MMLGNISRSTLASRKVSLALCTWIFLTACCSGVHAAAARTVKPSVRVSELSRQSWHHFNNGNKKEGIRKLHEIRTIIGANPDLHTPNTKKFFHSTIEELEKSEKTIDIKIYTPLIGHTLKSLDPIGKYNLSSYLVPDQAIPKPQVKVSPADALVSIAGRLSNTLMHSTITAPAAVKDFGEQFRGGTLNPIPTLEREMELWKRKNPATAEMIFWWLSTPKNKRVFVTGSKYDDKYVQTFRDQAEAEGHKLFFYKDCVPLCSQAAVGAFFASSSTWVHIDSPGARESPFVPVEIAAIHEYQGLGTRRTTINIIDISEIDFSRPRDAKVRITRVDCLRYKVTHLNDAFGCFGNSAPFLGVSPSAR
jgi:hypothetical protein